MNRRERIADELLVLSCQEGDSAAFARLVDRWQQRLWRHAWRLTGDEEAAWDAVQEAWISIARDIGRLEDAVAFPAWAYRVTGNKCRDWIRREQRRRRADETYSNRQQKTQDESQVVRQRCENVKEALEMLSGRDRAILSLKYLDGFDTAQIAEIMDIPPGTVKSRLFYARQRLRDLMEDTSHD